MFLFVYLEKENFQQPSVINVGSRGSDTATHKRKRRKGCKLMN